MRATRDIVALLRMAGIAGVLLLATGLAAARGEAFLHNGVVRSYELVVPPGLALPAPALVLLHGGGGSGRQLRDHIGFEDFAAEAGVIGVFPDSVERLWNDGRTSPDLADAQARAGDDAGFIVALVDALAAAGVVDAGRVGVGGISNGGMMTLRLACVAPGRFVAFAVVAANMAVGIECPQGPPAPMLFVHGSEDPIIRYGGGPIIIPLAPGRVRGTALPVPETMAIWAQRNGCGSPPALHARLDLRPFDGTAVAIYDYPGCRANLRHILIEGGGHAWPGARQRLLGLLSGRTSREIDATVAIWAFVTAQSSR